MPAKKKKTTKRLKVEELEETTPDKEDSKTSDQTEKEKVETSEVPEEKADEEKEKVETKDSTKISSFKLADIDSSKDDDQKKQEDVPEDLTKDDKKEEDTTEVDAEKENDVEEEKEDTKTKESQDWLDDVKPESDEKTEVESGSSKKKIILIILLLIIFGGVVGGGFYYYQTSFSQKSEETEIAPEAKVVTPTEELDDNEKEATDSAEFSTSDYSIQILNGSGVAGEAGNVEDLISDSEFKEIDTGNADSYDYVETEVKLKENVSDDAFDLIKESLKEDYIVTKSDDSLDQDSEWDILIIVGSKKVEKE